MNQNIIPTIPLFQHGDRVNCNLHPNRGILTIKNKPEWSGFNWVYKFEKTQIISHEEYLTKAENKKEE